MSWMKDLPGFLKFLWSICLFVKKSLQSRGREIGDKIKTLVRAVRARTVIWVRQRARLLLFAFLLVVLAFVGIRIWSRQIIVMAGPSGKMGDIGDVRIESKGVDSFTYETRGRGPHQWEWKYDLDDEPAQFAGVMYLQPPNNWGDDPNGGVDLSRARSLIAWEARSIGQDVYVEFVIGGINWMLDKERRQKVRAPYPDSMPRRSLGTKRLTTEWHRFSANLKKIGLDREEYFHGVIGRFGWVISWAPNGVRLNEDGKGPDVVKVFQIEIRNIQYERR